MHVDDLFLLTEEPWSPEIMKSTAGNHYWVGLGWAYAAECCENGRSVVRKSSRTPDKTATARGGLCCCKAATSQSSRHTPCGIYLIKPWTRTWFLDQNRELPKLKVSRYQLPLGPAYAVTAHGSQGQT